MILREADLRRSLLDMLQWEAGEPAPKRDVRTPTSYIDTIDRGLGPFGVESILSHLRLLVFESYRSLTTIAAPGCWTTAYIEPGRQIDCLVLAGSCASKGRRLDTFLHAKSKNIYRFVLIARSCTVGRLYRKHPARIGLGVPS